MRIYLDNCCFNRPFDDQSNLRIHLESEAIKVILKQCEQKYWHLVISDVNLFEIAKNTDAERRQKLEALAKLANETVELTTDIRQRAKNFEHQGIKAFDALHLACAEHYANIFLTVDDRLYKKAQILSDLETTVTTPLLWTYKVL